jgi:hypothetical protein
MNEQNNHHLYYLISQECPNESQMMTYDRDVLQKLEYVCVDHVDNLFEVIQYDEKSFKITRIIKNEGLGDKFNVGDVIYLFSGMVSFHTQNCEKCECHPTVIIEHNKITLFEDNDDADNEDKE